MSNQKGNAVAGGRYIYAGNKKFQAFTLVELLVVISIIAVLLAVLMPALNRAKKQARSVIDLTNLKQWGLMYSMYCQDNSGYFFSGEVKGSSNPVDIDHGRYWRAAMQPYSKNDKMWLCPETLKPKLNNSEPAKGDPIETAWAFEDPKTKKVDVGSYGLNAWVLNPSQSMLNGGEVLGRKESLGYKLSDYWRNSYIKGANKVPVFSDAWFTDAWPKDNDMPALDPPSGPGKNCAGDIETYTKNEIQRLCVDRHAGNMGMVFMDWSARKVGLKELWTLKWHKSFNTAGRYTSAGGYKNWPTWMKKYKDY